MTGMRRKPRLGSMLYCPIGGPGVPSDQLPTHTMNMVARSSPAFRNYSGARDCTVYDQSPYGMKNRAGYTAKQSDEQLKQQLVSWPTTYLLGELDVLPLAVFDGSCPAMAQGPTRLARGQAFSKLFVNEKLGANHAVRIVPECGHNARCMFTALLFPK